MNWESLKKDFTENLVLLYDIREAEQIFFLVISELGISKVDFLLNKRSEVSNDEVLNVQQIINKLKDNIPIQHILGFGYFYERKFKVNKDVLIPRLETEELVHLIIQRHKDLNSEILDIGTGTGCIPITLKLENPKYKISSIDISKDALQVAKTNAFDLKADVNFCQANILDTNSLAFKDCFFDIIVSNPPYVRQLEKQQMNKNVLDFDPDLALFVEDNDPLLFYNSIVLYANKKLKTGGSLYFEINEAFADEVSALMIQNGFVSVQISQDMQQKDRIVYGHLER